MENERRVQQKAPAGRYALLDELRGLDLVSMMLYHACWDMMFLFGIWMDWYAGMPGRLWQQHLPTELAIGVILVGTCPGGTSSNVMTYLSKGDVALSVGMTAVSTVLAPLLTPLLTLLYAGQRVDVNPMSMFMSIVKVVLVPIALGFVVNHFFHKFTEEAVRVLPLVSTTAIVLIICAVVSANSAKIMTSGLLILVVVILHNVLGYLTGFGVGKLLKLDSTKCRAISIEVGMQNSGLATSLAAAHFAQYPLATIPGAVFSVWHNISGAILANFFARTAEKKD